MDVTIACPCPGTPHPDGDTVTLRDRFGFRDARTIRNEVGMLYGEDRPPSAALILATLSDGYVRAGIERWTLVDAKGEALAITPDTVDEFLAANPLAADELADKADELYSAAVVGPLAMRAARSLPPSPTDGSTSARTPSSSPARPRPLRPSSTTTTPTAATATTSPSPAGDSSSSPKSASAA